MTAALKAPFPYPGGKSQIAPKVWELLGDPDHYIEPFAGSLAVLLARPHYRPGVRLHETVGDYSARIAHIWRAIKLRPAEVAEACIWPAHEIDYHARHAAILRDLPTLKARLLEDPDWCDPRIAGWEVWGLSMQISQDWMKETRLGGRWQCTKSARVSNLDPAEILALGDRLRHVSTLYGDWRRCVSSKGALRGPLMGDVSEHSIGVFMDPPYTPALNRGAATIYHADEASIAADVRAWCAEWGTRPWLRIVLAGHAGEHDDLLAHGWRRVDWTAGGMAGGGKVGAGQQKERQEALWASPACLTNDTPLLSWRSNP